MIALGSFAALPLRDSSSTTEWYPPGGVQIGVGFAIAAAYEPWKSISVTQNSQVILPCRLPMLLAPIKHNLPK